jgi:hypothetical protein
MQPFVLHAHFYQPERMNPWTGNLDPEPSAAPHRDWNDRVHAEAYRPNAFARIFDGRRRVERIVNNSARLSFNLGPTLLRWLERRHRDTYGRILDGDWRSIARTGHGNALAAADAAVDEEHSLFDRTPALRESLLYLLSVLLDAMHGGVAERERVLRLSRRRLARVDQRDAKPRERRPVVLRDVTSRHI